ncbi:MAG: Uma2 family endonuclease [Richelia sp. CSU_2_1]|nr:Uma2 family endonuclease [Microcoleus sp. SU_5_6]NJR21617.1 Uma2 family endonuclease [Richelia sp. CSU_2_1]
MIISSVEQLDAEQLDLTWEEWLQNPPDGTEWVDGKVIVKHPVEFVNGEVVGTPTMTAKTRRIQSKLNYYWRSYMISSSQGGEVYVEVTCQTLKKGRIPDVSYITPELLSEVGEFSVLRQSFPLLAEIVSPSDFADDVFAKAQEYLKSGCLEVWLLFPKSSWVLVITQNGVVLFKPGEVARTQVVLPGFSVAVDELMA